MEFPERTHFAGDDLPKSIAECFVEECVEERIHRRADVAEPRDEAEDVVADAAGARWAGCHQHIDDEERGPKEHECEKYNTENLRQNQGIIII